MSPFLTWAITFVTWAITLIAIALLIRQCRKPFGLLGRSTARRMNARHASVTQWGLSHVRIGPAFRILDVGCGGGQTVLMLARLVNDGHVTGVDYPAASLAVARHTNAALIAAGRVAIEEASVSALPFGDGTFDLVTAVETHYYWPNPPGDLKEIVRVLKPGGRVVIIAETYRGQRGGAVLAPFMRLLGARYQTAEQHRAWFEGAGLSDIAIDTDSAKGWMCVIASPRRPSSPA